MNALDVRCEVCKAGKGVPCHNPCRPGELRPSGACIGRVERSTPKKEQR
jgi:hypothetical protein